MYKQGDLVRFIRRDDDDNAPDSITLGKVYAVRHDEEDGLMPITTDDGEDFWYYSPDQFEPVNADEEEKTDEGWRTI